MDHRQPPVSLPPPPLMRNNAASPFDNRPGFPTPAASAYSPSQSPSQHRRMNELAAASNHDYRSVQHRESPYYSRAYETTSASPAHHARHHSTPSIASVPPLHRTMAPPPGSPPNTQGSRPSPSHSSNGHSLNTAYPPPPHAPRPPSVATGSSSNFPGGRELPALSSLPRTGAGSGGSMSIMSMLGGPAPSREPASNHTSQYSTPHASQEYGYRRPRTPDGQHRLPDPRVPPGTSPAYAAGEARRYDSAHPLQGRQPFPEMDRARDAGPPPPRPSSQPRSFNSAQPQRSALPDLYNRRGDDYGAQNRPGADRAGRVSVEEERRFLAAREREQMERELEHQERERRSRAYSGSDLGRHPPHRSELDFPPRDYRQHAEMQGREQWHRQPLTNARPGMEDGAPYGRQGDGRAPPVQYSHADPRYPAVVDRFAPSSAPEQQRPSHPLHPHGSPERQRMMPDLQHTPSRRALEEGPPPPSVAYSNAAAPYESPRKRLVDDGPPTLERQRSLLGLQDANRRGRASPMPQPVQGAQAQPQGPAGEPGIKSEFGRMFSGLGTGVTGLSPMAAGAQLHYANGGPNGVDMDRMPRSVSRNKRRKINGEDDSDHGGRLTPLGRGKKSKTNAPHHHHHHHHHHHAGEQVSSPGLGHSMAPHAAVQDMRHFHHHTPLQRKDSRGPYRQSPMITALMTQVPKPKQIISNDAVIQSVADRPRKHLGKVEYEATVIPARLQDPKTRRPPRQGYESNPIPLPWEMIQDKENCTLTVKIDKMYLAAPVREEVTSRRAVWGTDIYTDDSDILAACIHGGWIRGEWAPEVDVAMLDLEPKANGALRQREIAAESWRLIQSKAGLDSPPKSGPVDILPEHDLHVKILILPLLDKYTSTTRHGLRSREFGGKLGRDGQIAVHDGISFSILNVKYVAPGSQLAPSRLRGKARRDRMHKAMAHVGDQVKRVNDAAASTSLVAAAA